MKYYIITNNYIKSTINTLQGCCLEGILLPWTLIYSQGHSLQMEIEIMLTFETFQTDLEKRIFRFTGRLFCFYSLY